MGGVESIIGSSLLAGTGAFGVFLIAGGVYFTIKGIYRLYRFLRGRLEMSERPSNNINE